MTARAGAWWFGGNVAISSSVASATSRERASNAKRSAS